MGLIVFSALGYCITSGRKAVGEKSGLCETITTSTSAPSVLETGLLTDVVEFPAMNTRKL